MQDLGTLGGDKSLAEAINNLGLVGGYSYIDAVRSRAFLLTPEQGIQDLGSFDDTYSPFSSQFAR